MCRCRFPTYLHIARPHNRAIAQRDESDTTFVCLSVCLSVCQSLYVRLPVTRYCHVKKINLIVNQSLFINQGTVI